MSKPHYLSAVEALRLFRSRDLSPVELMESVVERTAETNGTVNAFTETMFGDALAAARDAEQRYQRGDYDGGGSGSAAGSALLGLPIATKEKHAIAGRSLSQGLLSCADDVAAADHPVVERIKAAGGIIHARTTSPEFSCATITHSPMWGVTRNPWNPEYSPGGSSGGAGAALAAGMATLATASDIAGSTRLPASFTGNVGFKAPYGRIPGMPPLSNDWYRGDGPMARTVADTALLTNVMSGPHPIDHTSVGPAEPLPLEFGPVDGMRIALCVRLGDYPVMADVEANTRAVAAALEAAGAVVVEIDLPWSSREISETIFTHFGHLLGTAMQEATAGSEDQLAPYTRRFMADARAAATRNSLLDGLKAETRIQAQLATAMAGFDALLCPASAVSALKADEDYLDGIDVGGVHLDHYWQAHMTAPFNINNRCPVLAVPSGLSDVGVPTGVQIVGHPYDDLTVFRVGAAVEQARPWAGKLPPL
ncbi:amidase [Arthrobacter crystallopoietes]|uniref:Aspartyl-tRNA(Asn)/glutamyl-tRNA(Gln) amidotransferase subunit A n=1 Tax=Crystallibacter crystallopoietes TaxID=37928 RepID=A0A1H1AQQ8_9MICC|nr:amidase [Arthrobacter crystallopoietes]AUI51449.1 amidase [Arthrobacter crystallopoietes]SDQ41516.1 aspartyl-tRNA(Asn)/glutamyl-tRNA(Gln) amidotransferase subunit A [Arthrobacter crystallopoietes]